MATASLPRARAALRTAPSAATAAACALWAALLLAGHLLAARLVDADPLVHLGAPPFVGRYEAVLGAALLPAAAFALAAVAAAPRLARTLPWRTLLAVAWGAAAAWAVLLALGDGTAALTAPLRTRYEYLAVLPRIGSPGTFLHDFTTLLPSYPTHVKGHPPGIPLLFWAMARVGLGGAGPAAALVIGAGALAAPAALVTVRALAGEDAARTGAPLLALMPGAVWVATSGDALILGTSACAIACVAAAAAGAPGRRADLTAAAGGLLLGVALLCSYGVLPLGAVVLAAALAPRGIARGVRVCGLTGAALLSVLIAAGAAGFWWPDGLRATHELYAAGVASRRPYLDFLVIAPAAFAAALGPAAAAGLPRVLPRLRVLVAAGVLAVAAADLSGLSRGENERIWLLFTPWMLCAAVALGRSRRWLAAQLLLGLALQTAVRSPW